VLTATSPPAYVYTTHIHTYTHTQLPPFQATTPRSPCSGGGGKDVGGGGDHEKKRKLTFLEIKEIFATLDKNGDGDITHAEFITGMKKNPWVATKLGMPTNVRQEDGTRESYQLSFGKIDNDNSKSIQFSELCRFFGYYEDGQLVSDCSEQSGDSYETTGTGGARDRKGGDEEDEERKDDDEEEEEEEDPLDNVDWEGGGVGVWRGGHRGAGQAGEGGGRRGGGGKEQRDKECLLLASSSSSYESIFEELRVLGTGTEHVRNTLGTHIYLRSACAGTFGMVKAACHIHTI
jgi:hypothetical protein